MSREIFALAGGEAVAEAVAAAVAVAIAVALCNKLDICCYHCQVPVLLLLQLLLYDHDVFIFFLKAFFDAERLDVFDAVFTKRVDAQAVFFEVEAGERLLFQLGELLGVEVAFEDAVLNARAKVEQALGELGAAFVVDDVVGNDEAHGRPFSGSWQKQ